MREERVTTRLISNGGRIFQNGTVFNEAVKAVFPIKLVTLFKEKKV